MSHIGFIDENDPYMALRADDYPGNAKNLKIFNFKKEKEQAYERAQAAINQGLVLFPNDLNARNEMEIQEERPDGQVVIRYEKVTNDEMNALSQMSILKEELVGMSKVKKPSGNVVFELSPDAKQRNMHDDRADCVAMILNRLMELRAEEALAQVEKPKTEFQEMFKKANAGQKKTQPFGNMGANPFNRYKGKFK